MVDLRGSLRGKPARRGGGGYFIIRLERWGLRKKRGRGKVVSRLGSGGLDCRPLIGPQVHRHVPLMLEAVPHFCYASDNSPLTSYNSC